MSETATNRVKAGTVGWYDLTVANAEQVREFYQAVVGWESSPVSMGDYSDFCMRPRGTDQPIAGICHARGRNAAIPPQWLLHFVVDDLEASVRACIERGGAVVDGPHTAGASTYCIIRDPAGAVCALYKP